MHLSVFSGDLETSACTGTWFCQRHTHLASGRSHADHPLHFHQRNEVCSLLWKRLWDPPPSHAHPQGSTQILGTHEARAVHADVPGPHCSSVLVAALPHLFLAARLLSSPPSITLYKVSLSSCLCGAFGAVPEREQLPLIITAGFIINCLP